VFGLIGFLLGRAAARHDPGEAGGVRESLLTLAGSAAGRWPRQDWPGRLRCLSAGRGPLPRIDVA
jgi:hypothetical protein